jgi:hypothetical protein
MISTQQEASFPKFVTIAELVAAAKISRQTVSRKLRLNEIPHVKVGARILIPSSFLVDLESAAWSATRQGGGDV